MFFIISSSNLLNISSKKSNLMVISIPFGLFFFSSFIILDILVVSCFITLRGLFLGARICTLHKGANSTITASNISIVVDLNHKHPLIYPLLASTYSATPRENLTIYMLRAGWHPQRALQLLTLFSLKLPQLYSTTSIAHFLYIRQELLDNSSFCSSFLIGL